MRAFIDAILAFIGASSLTDGEFDALTIESAGLDLETYNAILAVLDAREVVSDTRSKLTLYFQAAGVTVTEASAAKSNIYLGSALECE